ncbi:MAG: DUF4396 domain-containing protein [Verrucomicrobiota bacterium JB022]|nr:DUF4396 domain-containing protein [Verrucomicrobiota bacterium JB022]
MNAIRDFISNPTVMSIWLVLMALSLAVLIWDLAKNNREIMPLMKVVWGLTVLYSGPVGLAVYYYSGRKQIARDSLWRKSFRSVSHCYSGCGAGEVTGLVVLTGVLAVNSNLWVGLCTFVLAYIFGFGMTMGPLLQDGESFGTALKDAAYSESASIAVMEVVAIGVDFWLAKNAQFGEPLFWSSLVVSLSVGLIAAYPVNVLLIKFGVKEGMHNPKEMAKHAHHGEDGGHAHAH